MPTYDYECGKCGHAFEAFQSISADPLKKCPKCGKNALQRLIGGGAALLFKGSGFYITDYRSGDYAAKASADKPAPAKPEGGCAAGKPDAACPCKSEPAAKPRSSKKSKAS